MSMRDVRVAEKAAEQFNRISRAQLADLGLSRFAIADRLASGRLVIVEQGVFALTPLNPDDDWGKWMGAVLTAPGSALSHISAAAAEGFWTLPRLFETITRPGNGGPRRHGGVLVHRSATLEPHVTELRGIPITTTPRTLLDLAPHLDAKALARCVREAVRLKRTTVQELAEFLARNRDRRGSRALAATLARYSGLPIERARSGAEVRAMEILRDAGRPLPALNVRRAGEEADLSWELERLIIEIDGGPFHQDAGEDARKQGRWEAAGWLVRRLDADLVYRHPERLLALAPA